MNWKRMGKKLLFPPGWVMAILSLFSAVALTAVFVQNSYERVHRRQLYSPPAEKICAIIFFAAVFFSAFVPAGPLPVLIAGSIWLFFTEKR